MNMAYEKRKDIRTRAIEIKKQIQKSNRVALELLMHPDATPEQIWELHKMMVESRQKALVLEDKLKGYFPTFHPINLLGD